MSDGLTYQEGRSVDGFYTPRAISYLEVGTFILGVLDTAERRKDNKREVGTVKKEKEKDTKVAKK